MTPAAKFRCTLWLGLMLSGPASAALIHADQVVSFTPGSGPTHPNFVDPNDALGAPDFFDPGTGFGFGAVSLGAGGVLTLRMAAEFTVGGDPAADLRVYEIGPSLGGSAEATKVEISKDGVAWFDVGTTPGGTAGLDIDALGFTHDDLFEFVRLTDVTLLTGQPAGADIDAVQALHAAPGDCDGDGDVDLDDLAGLPGCMLGPDIPADAPCECLDADSDGDVDMLDFARLQERFNG